MGQEGGGLTRRQVPKGRDAIAVTPSPRRCQRRLRDDCSTQAPAPKEKKKRVCEFYCRCKVAKKRCPGYKHFLAKGDLKKANEHYNEKNAAGQWVKAVPPEGDPVEFIKVPRGPGFRGGYILVKAPASA